MHMTDRTRTRILERRRLLIAAALSAAGLGTAAASACKPAVCLQPIVPTEYDAGAANEPPPQMEQDAGSPTEPPTTSGGPVMQIPAAEGENPGAR